MSFVKKLSGTESKGIFGDYTKMGGNDDDPVFVGDYTTMGDDEAAAAETGTPAKESNAPVVAVPAAKVGLGVVGTSLALYGAWKLAKHFLKKKR